MLAIVKELGRFMTMANIASHHPSRGGRIRPLEMRRIPLGRFAMANSLSIISLVQCRSGAVSDVVGDCFQDGSATRALAGAPEDDHLIVPGAVRNYVLLVFTHRSLQVLLSSFAVSFCRQRALSCAAPGQCRKHRARLRGSSSYSGADTNQLSPRCPVAAINLTGRRARETRPRPVL